MRSPFRDYVLFGALAIGLLWAGAAMPSTPPAPAQSTAPAEDIRDVRAPKPLPGPWPWIAAGGAVALIGLAAWFAMKMRPAVRMPSPREIALRRLEAARKWMESGRARDFCYEMSETIRCYIEQMFRIQAPRKTTEEFLRETLESSQSGLVEHREALAEFLGHCDMAKYAGWQFDGSEMESMLASARAFVTMTSEEPTTVENGGVGGAQTGRTAAVGENA